MINDDILTLTADAFKGEEIADGCYILPMLLENRIPGILPFRLQNRNGTVSCLFDLSGKQCLKELYEKKELTAEELLCVLQGIRRLYQSLRDYLLDLTGVIFKPEYVYFISGWGIPAAESGNTFEANPGKDPLAFFIYLPGYGEPVERALPEFAEFLITRTDHTDEKAVEIAYMFYKRVVAGDYRVDDLIETAMKVWEEEPDRQEPVPVKEHDQETTPKKPSRAERIRARKRKRLKKITAFFSVLAVLSFAALILLSVFGYI